jgi:indoleamine 2,3-dioxygenase
MTRASLENVAFYQVDPVRGFLPAQDPIAGLPAAYRIWDELGADLSALLMTGRLRPTLERLTPLTLDGLESESQRERAMLLLSVLANAYVWAEEKPATHLPSGVAVPLYQLANELGRPPITTYTSIVLYNWRRLDPTGPIDLDNIAARQLFWGGIDEQWFYMVPVAIEAQGAAVIPALIGTKEAMRADRAGDLLAHLKKLASVLEAINVTLMRLPERCDPYIFYQRVRPYLTGWEAPGVVYEGVSEKPQKFYGGSAAQSPIVQCFDAVLGVRHRDRDTAPYLLEMRRYMSPAHRRFIEALEDGLSLHQYVLNHQGPYPVFGEVFNQCVRALEDFRRKHMEIAVRYIKHQAPPGVEPMGTGGTNFATFLGKALKETRESLIE